jgi:phosphoribosylanthranilate isomerase
MTCVKICGIASEEPALAAARAGADFIGLVFAASPRQVTPARARKIVAALKESGAAVETVGVFVNTSAAKVTKIADSCGLDWVQLSGDEPWGYCRQLARPVIKVVRISRDSGPELVCRDLAYGQKLLGKQRHMFLIDSSVPSRYGGTGQTFDWDLARPIAARFPVIIAGGLRPANVAAAIEIIAPWGVDVSSGVETKGVKDLKKIRDFIRNVRQNDG